MHGEWPPNQPPGRFAHNRIPRNTQSTLRLPPTTHSHTHNNTLSANIPDAGFLHSLCISTARHILHNAHHSPDHMFTVRPTVALRSLKSTDASRRRNKAHNVAGTPAAYGLHSTGARWLSPWRRWERERRRRLRTATTPNPLRSRTSAPMPPHVQLSPIYVLLGRPPKGSKANVLLFPSNSFSSPPLLIPPSSQSFSI